MCKTVKSYIDALRFEVWGGAACQHLLYWNDEPILLIPFKICP